MISSMVGVSFSHGKSVQKRCICGSGLFKAMETARPISCWTFSFVIPSFSAMIEYSCVVTPQVRQTGNRLSGLVGTAYASLLA